jgi:hypothetical protein
MSLLLGWAAALLGQGERADSVPRKRERLGARLDHGLRLQVEERAGAAQAVWAQPRLFGRLAKEERKRHGSMDFVAIN